MSCRVKKTPTEPAQNRSMHAHEHMNREPMDTHNHWLQHLPREIFAAALRCGRRLLLPRVCVSRHMPALLQALRQSHLKPQTANDHAQPRTHTTLQQTVGVAALPADTAVLATQLHTAAALDNHPQHTDKHHNRRFRAANTRTPF